MGGFGDYYGVNVVHPVGLTALIILGFALLLVPRRWAFIPILILACFIPSAQRIIIAGADFTFFRIMILFGMIRIFLRGETNGFRWVGMDTLIVAWIVAGAVVFSIRYGTGAAVINRCGWALDGAGGYLLYRCLIRSWDDLEMIFGFAAIIAVAVAAFMTFEWITRWNVFGVFGGVPLVTVIREGRLRCQGAFSHSILAGCFWAVLLPGIVGRFRYADRRWPLWGGVAACLLIVVLCASSTPLMTVAVVAIGLIFFPLRSYTQYMRWGLLCTLIGLHLVMNKPVWHLMARVDFVGGSTGWHRYKILDTAINHWLDWIIMGVSNVLAWGVWQMRDITNQYLYEGFNGGGVTLAIFIALIVCGFVYVGKAMRVVNRNRSRNYLAWCLGVMLLGHTITFFGVSYFGQITALWHLTLAMIGSMYTFGFAPATASRPKPATSGMHGRIAVAP